MRTDYDSRVFHKLSTTQDANIGNFILAVPLEKKWANDVYNLELYLYYIH